MSVPNELLDEDKFNRQKLLVDFIGVELSSMKARVLKLEKKLRIETETLQKLCKHNFVRECINDSCYREYAYICTKCKMFR